VSSTFSVKQMLVQSLRLRDKTFVIAFLNKYHADDACFSLFESVAAAPTEYALSNLSRGASARFLFLKWINLVGITDGEVVSLSHKNSQYSDKFITNTINNT